ncbi:MAG: ATP synthase subunit C [Gammaproteobacteria bacterium]|nr:ATP synthase subunit C [Gammaproteobacteria bacterium]
MTSITIVLTISLLAMILLGIYLEMQPAVQKRKIPRWVKGSVGVNLLLFVGGVALLLFAGVNEAAAQQAGQAAGEISVGYGLALIGIGLPTGLAAIGAGLAVSSVGSASLAVIVEKPEIFGRTLVYLGLAEGIAIYGLVITILMLGKI